MKSRTRSNLLKRTFETKDPKRNFRFFILHLPFDMLLLVFLQIVNLIAFTNILLGAVQKLCHA